MKPIVTILFICFLNHLAKAQNIGINYTTPRFPISFNMDNGDKISLFDDGNPGGANFGFGVLDGQLLQIHAPTLFDDIAFGTGNSAFFTERVRIKGNGNVGLGTVNPVNRLDVAGLNNWDLFNTEGDMRIGNSTYRLKMGIALAGGGAGATGIMQSGGIGTLSLGANTKYLIQLNGTSNFIDFTNISGGIRLNGSAGNAGQVLTSNGNASAPTWKSATNSLFNNTISREMSTSMVLPSTPVDLPGLTYAFSVPGNAKLLISYNLFVYGSACPSCTSNSAVEITVTIDNNQYDFTGYNIPRSTTQSVSETLAGTTLFQVGAGPHTVRISAVGYGPQLNIGEILLEIRNNMIVQIINE